MTLNNDTLTISKFSEDLKEYKGVKVLKASGGLDNQIFNVPYHFFSSPDLLQSLILPSCKILAFDASHFTNLSHVDLANNKMDIVIGFSELANLEYVDLSKNRLTTLANTGLTGAKNLRQLILNYNFLSELPKDISDWSSLVEIDLNQNKLRELPAALFVLPNIKHIDLSNNSIYKLPALDLTASKSLEELRLTGNPLTEADVTKIKEALPDVKVIFNGPN